MGNLGQSTVRSSSAEESKIWRSNTTIPSACILSSTETWMLIGFSKGESKSCVMAAIEAREISWFSYLRLQASRATEPVDVLISSFVISPADSRSGFASSMRLGIEREGDSSEIRWEDLRSDSARTLLPATEITIEADFSGFKKISWIASCEFKVIWLMKKPSWFQVTMDSGL